MKANEKAKLPKRSHDVDPDITLNESPLPKPKAKSAFVNVLPNPTKGKLPFTTKSSYFLRSSDPKPKDIPASGEPVSTLKKGRKS